MPRSSNGWVWRGVNAGIAASLALAVVLSLVSSPPSEATRRAVDATNRSLAEAGVTAIGSPTVTGGRSVFDDPAGALWLAFRCLALGVVVGALLGWLVVHLPRPRRPLGGDPALLLALAGFGALVTAALLGVASRFRTREVVAFGAFWSVFALAAIVSGARAPSH